MTIFYIIVGFIVVAGAFGAGVYFGPKIMDRIKNIKITPVG
jgi:hypothetical protein